MAEEETHATRPSFLRRQSSGSENVVSIDESGLHVNHLEGHQQHLDSAFGSTHTYETEEAEAFAVFINNALKDESGLEHLLPLDPQSNDIFTKHEDGLILLALLNHAIPGCVNAKHVNHPRKGSVLNVFKKNENLNYFFKVAHDEGCNFVNIGSQDVSSGKEIAILSILWQLFRIQLLANITIKNFPELSALLREDETMETFLLRSPEYILLRWMKYHFEFDGEKFTPVNFGPSMKDPFVFFKVLHHIDDSLPFHRPEDDSAATKLDIGRHVVVNAHTMGVRTTTTAADLISSAASVKIAFAAQIFNCRHGLPPPTAAAIASAKALPDPPGMHHRKLTDADRAEKEAKEAEQREAVLAAVNRVLTVSNEAAELARQAEMDSEAVQNISKQSHSDATELSNRFGTKLDVVLSALKIALQIKEYAESTHAHCNESKSLANAIRLKYEEAAVCIEVSEVDECFAVCDGKLEKLKKEARDCHEERELAEKLASQIVMATAEANVRVAHADAAAAAERAQAHLNKLTSLRSSTDDAVLAAVEGCQGACSVCVDSAAEITKLVDLFIGPNASVEAPEKVVETAEQLRIRSLEAEKEAENFCNAALAAAEKLELSQQIRKAHDLGVAAGANALAYAERTKTLDQGIDGVKSHVDDCLNALRVANQAVEELAALLNRLSGLSETSDFLSALSAANDARERAESAERLSKEALLAAENAVEKERLAREAAERAEQERLAREAAERAEQERLAREAAERAEQERLARESAERAEQERLAREAAERAEQERLAREAAERAEQEKRERLAREAAEREEQERLAREAAERERADQERRERESQQRREVQTGGVAQEEGLSSPLLQPSNSSAVAQRSDSAVAQRSWWKRCCFCCYYQ